MPNHFEQCRSRGAVTVHVVASLGTGRESGCDTLKPQPTKKVSRRRRESQSSARERHRRPSLRFGRATTTLHMRSSERRGGWQADLIVMGTHGQRGMVRWMLGTVAGRVAHLTQTPLLLVYAPEVQSK
jgi:nucleotide-binding universal stress UspA family protein